jgi:hypothetical protein
MDNHKLLPIKQFSVDVGNATLQQTKRSEFVKSLLCMNHPVFILVAVFRKMSTR